MAIQELNQVEIESVSGGLTTFLYAVPVLGPILGFLFKGEGELLGGELLSNPLGIVSHTLNNGVSLVSGLLGALLGIVGGLLG